MPGMDVRASLTVVGDGPVGAVGRQLDELLGMPAGHHRREWAVGMKFVVDLPEDSPLRAGTVLHTLGFPEPEIFGFLYVHPDRVASVGIFVPSWFETPVRTAYRYLQHYMQHPYLWRYLEGGQAPLAGARSRSSSRAAAASRVSPATASRASARARASTNVLTGSGVDEAWDHRRAAGRGRASSCCEAGKPFTRENLEAAYVRRRRASWVEAEGRVAEKARDGFQRGVVTGLLGMALAGLTGGKVSLGEEPPHPAEQARRPWRPSTPAASRRTRSRASARTARPRASRSTTPSWTASAGRPIPLDGKLLVSQQDALLMGGKVQAPPGYADHVVFLRSRAVPRAAASKVCVEICSGQAIRPGEGGVPAFDREKCVHCGACLWNCTERLGRHRAGEPRVPRRRGRAALGGELIRPDSQGHYPRRRHASFQIVVCGSIVPDPLQTLEPVAGAAGPRPEERDDAAGGPRPLGRPRALRGRQPGRQERPGSKVWLVSLGPKAKLQQVMMTVAQKVPFELVALDGPAGGFTDAAEVAAGAGRGHRGAFPGLDRSRLLVFGGWESASRGAGVTMQMVGERLGIADQFQGVDELTVAAGRLARDPGARRGRQAPGLGAAPAPPARARLGHRQPARAARTTRRSAWPTCAPSCRRCRRPSRRRCGAGGVDVRVGAALPKQQRETRIVKDLPAGRDRAGDRRLDPRLRRETRPWKPILLLAHTEADGSLPRPALEALGGGAVRSAAKPIVVGLVGGDVAAGRRPDRRRRRGASSGGRGRRLRAAALRHRRRRRRGARAGPPARTVVVAPATSRWPRVAAGRGPAAGRARRHARHRRRRRGRRRRRHPLVLPPAHGGDADARTQRPWVLLVDPGCYRAVRAGAAGAGRGGEPWRSTRPASAHHGDRRAGARGRRADHPARRQAALRGRRRLDQEAGRRPDARRRGRRS